MPIVSGNKAKEIEKLLKIKPTPEVEKGIKILENMFEKDPCILKRVALYLKKYSNFGICLDWAHASLSNAYPEDWAEALGEYVKHIHINDNNLIVLIETKSIENQKKSIECLKADGVL